MTSSAVASGCTEAKCSESDGVNTGTTRGVVMYVPEREVGASGESRRQNVVLRRRKECASCLRGRDARARQTPQQILNDSDASVPGPATCTHGDDEKHT